MHVFAFTALRHSSSCSLKLRRFLILILLASTYATGGNAELIKKQEPAKHLNQSISDTASISIEGQAMPVKVNVSKPSFEQSKVGPKKRVLEIPLPVDTRVAKPKQQSKASMEQAFKSIDVMKDLKKSSRNSSNLKSFTTNEKKHKAKPTVTIGDSELDKPIPASPTKTTAGEPRKVDYIVPMLITVSVLPFLGMTLHILYKQGKDYWDKRHYRRMDFLINGMYNE